MSKEREEKFDPTLPTLIVKHGNTTRKYRPLEKDVLVLGRAPGCDVGLEAPDVAPVHCVIVRAADGWCVRDCTGRGATRLNGRSVQDEALHDEDVLQVGSFSFTLHLPPEKRRPDGPSALRDAAVRRAQRSRRRLAQLALRLRGRLRQAAAPGDEHAENQFAERQEELDRQAEDLDALQRDLDARLGELRRTRQEIGAESLALLERHERVEKELAERQARADADVRALMEGCQARCRELEASHARALEERQGAHAESVGDDSRRLEIRARELGCYASHLLRTRQRLNEHEDSLTARWEEWLREQQEASLQHARQREQIAREETLLREQRSEVVRLMGEMRQLRHNLHQQPDPRFEALRQENERLHQEVAEREQALAAAREEARQLAAEAAERRPADGAEGAPGGAGLDRFHVALEEDRRSLDEQIRRMQGRYSDLEQAAREAELQIARDRVRIVQGREELERLCGGVWPGEGRSPGDETMIDTPSPLHLLSAAGRQPEPDAAAARSPSKLAALDG